MGERRLSFFGALKGQKEMKGRKLKTKVLGIIIAFFIAVILSAIISTILHLIFTRVPEEIINIRPNTIIQSLSTNKEHFEMFVLTIVAFMLLAFLTIFKVFDLKDYKSKIYKVTNNIEIPLPIGEKQTQQGSAWWLPKKEFSKKFGVNRVDLSKKEFAELIKLADEDKKCIEKDKENTNTTKIEPIFKTGGLVIGKKDKIIPKFKCKKLGKLIRIPYFSFRKVEDIYYIDDDLHSLTVGATRSGKTRSEVTAEKISKKIGTYTTSSWSESNSSSGGAVNKSKSMNLTQRALLTTDEILRIERPYLLVMCSGLSPAMTNSPDLSKWYFNSILGLGNKSWNTEVREYR